MWACSQLHAAAAAAVAVNTRGLAGAATAVHWQAHDSVALRLQLQQSAVKEAKQNGAGRKLRPFDAQLQVGDRRGIGLYDARFHSTSWYLPQQLLCSHEVCQRDY